MHLTDKYCNQSCGLMLGCSETFKKHLINFNSIKSIRKNIPFELYDSSSKQHKFKEILKDDILKMLSVSSTEIQIVQKALEGMERNYSKILSGEQSQLFIYPSMFYYDSRVGANETLNPDLLEKEKSRLEGVENLNRESEKTLDDIQNYLKRIKPQISEQEFFDAFVTLFFSSRGICIHSFKMDSYLSIFIEKAQKERKSNSSLGFGLTSLEKAIAKALNISNDELTRISEKLMQNLNEVLKSSDAKHIDGRKIHLAIDSTLEGEDKRKAKSKFKPGRKYTKKEIYGGIRLAIFESICKFAGENDLLIMLPDQKLIVCIEIKQHMALEGELSKRDHIDGNLKSAASQLRKNVEYILRVHGNILSPGWDFLKIAAISPRLGNMNRICESCRPFIITSDMIKEPGGITKWWNSLGLDKRKILNSNTRKKFYNEYLRFFNRIVNLSAVRLHPDPFQNWQQIQGDNCQNTWKTQKL